jgi:plasmid stabilization system protein ParE
MTYEVRSTAQADADARAIRDWIAQRSPDGALRWVDAFEDAKARLAMEASQLGLASEADAFDEPLRQISFKTRKGNTYRALYVIRAFKVYIVSIRGAGQDFVSPQDIEMPEQ